MKIYLIILNWLFGWVLLTYNGDDPVIAFIMVGWFGFATWLLNRNRKEVDKALKKFEKKMDQIINKQN